MKDKSTTMTSAQLARGKLVRGAKYKRFRAGILVLRCCRSQRVCRRWYLDRTNSRKRVAVFFIRLLSQRERSVANGLRCRIR